MIYVKFSQTEIALCQQIGRLRKEQTSKHTTDRKQDQTQNSLDIAINGVYAEYAVSKYLNLHFDLNCDYRKFGADLISRKGSRIDVKCANKEGGNLNAVIWSDSKPCDIFILTELRNTHVVIVGWIEYENFITDKNLRDIGNGPFYSLPQRYLKQFNEQSTA